MSTWENYPANYRQTEIEFLRQAICAGECAALIGLSGSGKSNLLGYLAARAEFPTDCPRLVLVDCNRLAGPGLEHFYNLAAVQLMGKDVQEVSAIAGTTLSQLQSYLEAYLGERGKVCLLVDRFEVLMEADWFGRLSNNLRALRDHFKYRLVYLVAARRPLDQAGELAELFFGHTLLLGPLSPADALWSAGRDARRYASSRGPADEIELQRIVQLSGGYPSLLRAVCEAWGAGTPLEENALLHTPPVARRLAEFWQDEPEREALARSGLAEHPWLGRMPAELRVANIGYSQVPGSSQLTAKEHLLLSYLVAHPGRVCEKDELVQAIWPEEVQFSRGVRDESLAQLVRRLRIKIEARPEEPVHLLTAPGRGYIYRL